jgi:hypothetical protein
LVERALVILRHEGIRVWGAELVEVGEGHVLLTTELGLSLALLLGMTVVSAPVGRRVATWSSIYTWSSSIVRHVDPHTETVMRGAVGREGRLETQGGSGGLEGGRVDRRHPDAGLVDFEQVSDQGIEVDVGVCEVVEGELLAIPKMKVSLRTVIVKMRVKYI